MIEEESEQRSDDASRALAFDPQSGGAADRDEGPAQQVGARPLDAETQDKILKALNQLLEGTKDYYVSGFKDAEIIANRIVTSYVASRSKVLQLKKEDAETEADVIRGAAEALLIDRRYRDSKLLRAEKIATTIDRLTTLYRPYRLRED